MACLSRPVRSQDLFECFGVRVRFCEFYEVACLKNLFKAAAEPIKKVAPPFWRTQFE